MLFESFIKPIIITIVSVVTAAIVNQFFIHKLWNKIKLFENKGIMCRILDNNIFIPYDKYKHHFSNIINVIIVFSNSQEVTKYDINGFRSELFFNHIKFIHKKEVLLFIDSIDENKKTIQLHYRNNVK